MPQNNPVHNSLSEPVEARFLEVLNQTVSESYEYGKEKYGTVLKTFNGRSEIQDGAEELVSALRYFVQLDMRAKKMETLLREWQLSHVPDCDCALCEMTDEALPNA